MVVYFDHKINVGQPGTFHLMAWHGTEPVLAVTAKIESENEGAVFLFTEDGERIETSPLQKKCLPSAINWHPSKLVLCMGWEDGIVYLYNLQTRELCRAQHIHNSAITAIQCSTNGTKIVTGDESGLLLIWKIDSRGRVQTKPLFQQHLREPLREIISQPRRNSNHDNYMEVRNLVRAAVSGDQKALDMFDWKKAGSDLQFPAFFASMESPAFYIGGASGGVYYLQESGSCNHLFSADGPILKLLFHKEKNILVTLTTNLILSQHSITNAGQVSEIAKVKLSGKTDNPSVTWAGKGILAMATGESVLRIYDMDREENYLLSLDGHQSYDSNEQILCVGFCDRKAVLAAGTQMGNIAMWQYSLVNNSVLKKVDGEENWKLQDPATVEGPVRELMWNPSTNLLAVNTSSMAYVLNEHTMSCSLNDQTAVVQIGPSSLAIDMFSSGTHHDIKTDIQVKGIYTTKGTLAVWNGKKVFIYDFSPDQSIIQVTGAFETESQCICLYQQNVYVLEQDKVQVRTLKGTEKQLLNFSETEGHPVCMDVCGNFLVVGTSNGMVRVYDLSRREAKPHSILKILHEVIPGFGKIVSVKCNCSGSRVSILSEKPNGEPCPKLYFWDLELDAVQFFNFETGHGEQDDYLSSQLSENITADMNDTERGKDQAAKDIAGRYPTSHFWDFREPRLICCEAKLLLAETKPKISVKKSGSLIGKEMVNVLPDTMIVSLFSTAENGVLVQESYGLDDRYSCLMGIDVPFHYLLKKSQNKENSEEENAANNSGSLLYPRMVVRKTMRDFVGLENSDTGTQEAMMNFSFYLAIGNMDEAFKAIKLIKSESVWENMAKMCVKSRRLDVASVCLGNMGHGRGAKALREAAKEPELDARVAVLAIHLNMLEDAERLIKSSKRYDLLNQFYQNSGQWSKAKETAEMYDRIHLRTTYYNYAKDLEARGEIQASIPNYEKSDTHRYEVPRMLYEDSAHLMEYIMRSKDKILHKWYAQYLESVGDLNSATQQYEIAQDFLSLVRIACYCNEMNKAADICNQTGDRAACYHLARQYEIKGHIRESIHFFTRAEGFGNAIRLCMEHGFVDQILNLALLGRPEDMMMAARFFEEQQEMEDKAVMLYHKAGNFSKAMELSFQSKQFGALQLISSDLDERADPELVQRCANFFLENKQYDKAVDLLALGKKYWDAVNLCMEQHVLLTEELVEKLTPVKEDTMDQLKILEAIAEVCMHQGQYHLATKKFTQAGNKIKAMKSLLKSGDTEKIVFFAGVSRQKEIYVMAANYLQSLDWRRDTEIMKNIIMFYTKGRALDLLAGFYDACAQVEIDEYQNYEKAMGALNEGYRCLKKASMKNQNVQEQRLEELTNKMTLIKKFISCRSYSDSPDEAIKQCQMLLEEPDLESSVRIGDVYSFIVEHHVAREKWKAAFSSLEELKNKVSKTSITLYISPKTVEKIYRSLGMPVPKPLHTDRINGLRNSPEDNGEFVEEEVAED